MALQFSCNDRHAYFVGNCRKKEDVVFYCALSILMVGWLVNGELERKWSWPNQYWHLLKWTEKTVENLG